MAATAITLLVTALAGLLIPGPGAVGRSDRFFTVGVVGQGSAFDGSLELRIGRTAWTVDRSGYQLVETSRTQTVSVWRTSDCTILLSFPASWRHGMARNTIDLGDGTEIVLERGGSDAVPTQSVADRPHAPSCHLPDTAAAPSPGAVEGSPSSSRAPSASPAALPSTAPFPWPTIPAPVSDPGITPFAPTGTPDATARRHGVVVRMWLSSPSVGQGEYVQAVVRATNTGSGPAWMVPGECRQPSTTVDVDLSSLVRPGILQDGRAASYKRRAVRRSGVERASFERWQPVRSSEQGVRTLASAECTGEEHPSWIRVGPGETLEEPFQWYPRWDHVHGRWQPLPPRTVPVTVTWSYAGRGRRPAQAWERRPAARIVATTTLQLTGSDPGLPSFPELVDRALADPRFGDWVRTSSPADDLWVDGWPGPTYPSHQHLESIAGKAPNGIVVLPLQKGAPEGDTVPWLGEALVDPWTGAVVDVVLE
jgi:hypothetical protein